MKPLNIEEKFDDQFFASTEGRNDIRRREIKIAIGALTPRGVEIMEQLKPDNIAIEKQIDLLAKYLMENFSESMGKSEGAIEMAVRLLEEYKYAKPIPEKLCIENKGQKNKRIGSKKGFFFKFINKCLH